MSGIELNKIAAAVLVAGIIAMVCGIATEGLYTPVEKPAARGYKVEGAVEAAAGNEGGAPAADTSKIAIADLLAKADAGKGATIAKKCQSCHDFTSGGPNKVGPNLYGVVGRKVASHPGFAYSGALSAKGGNWDEQSISQFIAGPMKEVPGTKMSFAGLKDPKERADVIAYLKTLK